MRYLVSLLLAALSFSAVGQGIPQLPYNPDATGDEFIGSPDLLELLSLYGEEFSSAILSEDGENAVVYIGDMSYPVCASSCNNLTGFWSLATIEDLGLVFSTLSHMPTWLKTTDTFSQYSMYWNNGTNSWAFNNTYITDIERCYCATRELPKVEYSYCSGGTPDSESFVGCINQKLAEGWYPLSGWPLARDRQGYVYGATNLSQTYGSQTHASFWRWAD